MAVIDMHVHAFPDKLAGRAIASLESGIDWRAVGDGTVAGLIESMDAAGVDMSVVCPIATSASQARGIFQWCKDVRSDRIVVFPSVHPDTPRAEKWIRKIAAAGFVGIKMHPMFQDFIADDERADPIYHAATKSGLFVQIHCGYDIAFGDDKRASPERIARVIDKHPGMKLICTHLGGWRAWDEVRRHLVGRDVYMETSFTLQWMDHTELVGIIRDHGPGRVMFGTDWPWASQKKQVELFDSLTLSKAEKRAILFNNAAELLGL